MTRPGTVTASTHRQTLCTSRLTCAARGAPLHEAAAFKAVLCPPGAQVQRQRQQLASVARGQPHAGKRGVQRREGGIAALRDEDVSGEEAAQGADGDLKHIAEGHMEEAGGDEGAELYREEAYACNAYSRLLVLLTASVLLCSD